MMHYVLTRAAYPASYPLEANRRRLALTRHVTARSLASQTERRWRWLVAVDPADPLLDERKAVLATAGVSVVTVPIHQVRDTDVIVPDGRLVADVDGPGRVWRQAIRADAPPGRVVTTRMDDDDALARDALARIRARLAPAPDGPMVWVLPSGYKWHACRIAAMRHPSNMFATLDSPDGRTIMDVKHGVLRRHWPVGFVDDMPGWLWVRHADTRSGARSATRPLVPSVSDRFDVDWAFLRSVA